LTDRRFDISSRDVEKRWNDPGAFRSAAAYVGVVVLLAGVAFTVYAVGDRESIPKAVATPVVLFVGALIAFGKTYTDWRAGRTWPIWQGAGWFLLALTLMSLGVPAMGLLG
jgi:ABC-type branched-subunit amino acid transport system substrate-binding protein